MKRFIALGLLVAMSALMAQAQTNPAGSTTKRKAAAKQEPSIAAQLLELRQALEVQQQQIGQQQTQIKQLSDQVQSRDQQIQQLQQKLDQSQALASTAASKADSAASESAKQEGTVAGFQNELNDLKQNSTSTALSLQETQTNLKNAMESPLALQYKGVT